MFSRVRAIKSLILGFTWAGAYGVSREITPVDTSLGPNAWMILFGILCLIMMLLLADGLPAAEKRERELQRKKIRQWMGDHPSNTERFKRRMQLIQQITSREMEKAQYGKHFPVRESVVVNHDTLLGIWDLANLAENETPVED